MKIRTLALMTLFSGVTLGEGLFRPVQEAAYWRTSGIDSGFVSRFVSNSVCQSSQALWDSCVQALDYVVHELKLADEIPFRDLKDASYQKRDFDFQAALKVLELHPSSQPKEMVFGRVVSAQLRVFDAHAQILPTNFLRETLGRPTIDYLGIGIDTEITAAGVFIRQIRPLSPASHADLKLNDRIAGIRGQTLPSAPAAQRLLSQLSEKRGRPMELVIEREGQFHSVLVTTAVLVNRDLEVDVRNSEQGPGLILSLRHFSEGICDSVESALRQGPRSWLVLDLRQNPGGLLSEALCVASLFVGSKASIKREIVSQSIPQEFGLQLKTVPLEEAQHSVRAQAVFPELPLVLLVSAKSKSAAEVLSSILQDRSRAWLVGERTFGKGTTQLVGAVPFNSNLRVLYTFSRFRREDGSTFQLFGVTPNFEVPFRMGAASLERTVWREADLEPNAIKSGTQIVWREPRAHQVEEIKSCIRVGRTDRKWMAQLKNGDYQKAYALAVLKCVRP